MVTDKERIKECHHELRNALATMQDIRKDMQKAVEIFATSLIDLFGQMHRIGEAIKECEKCYKQIEMEGNHDNTNDKITKNRGKR